MAVSISGGYENSSYTATASGVTATREDNFFYARPSVQWHVRQWLSLGAFYERSQNFSTGEGARSFGRDRVGLQAALAF